MVVFAEVWGALFYLINKILLSRGEGEIGINNFRIYGWISYLIGVPAWILILLSENNWIAAAVEIGGDPAMVLGLMFELHGKEIIDEKWKRRVRVFTYFMVLFGISFSLIEHNGITKITQLFEIGVVSGFLIGTHKLAFGSWSGWLFMALMNTSMASLMLIQDKPILVCQQLISLMFVLWGLWKSLNKVKPELRFAPDN